MTEDLKERFGVVAFLVAAVGMIFFGLKWLGVSEVISATLIVVIALYLHAEYLLVNYVRRQQILTNGLEIVRHDILAVSAAVRALELAAKSS